MGVVFWVALELQDLQVLEIVGTASQMDWEVLVTNPTPLVLAKLASHIGASTHLFYAKIAVLAIANLSLVLSPLIIVFIHLSLTRPARMRFLKTVVAILLLAKAAKGLQALLGSYSK